jgi:hypothetical protein
MHDGQSGELIEQLRSGRLGVALVPTEFEQKRSGARFVPLGGRVPPWETVIVTPTAHSAAVSMLLETFDVADVLDVYDNAAAPSFR